MYSVPTLLATALLGLASLSTCAGATITNVTFVGDQTNPLVVVFGSGFNPATAPTSLATPGSSGQDYGIDLHILDWSSNPTPFDAGYDDPANGLHDVVGLDNVNISDSVISFNLGSEYAMFGPAVYQLAPGDAYTVFVNDAVYAGTVAYPAADTAPEPASAGLILCGLAGLMASYRRRARTSPAARR
jgi:hypothetical protein